MKLFSIFDLGFSIGSPKSKRIFCLVLSALVLAVSFSAHAQQPAKVPRIGRLTGGFLSNNEARMQAFRQGLRN